MTHPALEYLIDEDFLAEFGMIGIPHALRVALVRSSEVQRVRDALTSGQVDESTIRRLVAMLFEDLVSGQLFAYDLTLASIAVVLESRATPFAREFLQDLAKLDRCELPMAIRVARESLKANSRVPSTRSAVSRIAPAVTPQQPWKTVEPYRVPDTENDAKNFQWGVA